MAPIVFAAEQITPEIARLQLAGVLVRACIWPAVVVGCVIFYQRQIRAVVESISERIERGDEVTTPWLKIKAPTNLPKPDVGAVVTADFMALVHSSWRYPKMDAKFGRPMWEFHAIIEARDEVLDRIESVRYLLDPAYPRPVRVVTDRASKFKLKELANGESTLRCEVKIRGQAELVSLERYINLTDTGPRL